jgi:chemotaxis protein MotB
MREAAKQPIIIKKIKKHAHGHHGGAWKVAYADFVTAMMAFFMLLWLLSFTTPGQRSAIQGYFENPSMTPGESGASTSIIDLEGSAPEAPKGQGDNTMELNAENIEKLAEKVERERLESLLEELKEAVEKSQALQAFKDQLLLDITSEGLRIQIVDKENRPMFDLGSDVLKNYTRDILHEIVKVINEVPNKISITGHTDQTPYSSHKGYSNWELSADRANAARRELVVGGMTEEKIGRVVGLSSSVLFDKENPFNPINRRISIIVMNKAAENAVMEGEGKAEPEKEEKKKETGKKPSKKANKQEASKNGKDSAAWISAEEAAQLSVEGSAKADGEQGFDKSTDDGIAEEKPRKEGKERKDEN